MNINEQQIKQHLEYLFDIPTDYSDGRIEVAVLKSANNYEPSELDDAYKKAIEFNTKRKKSTYIVPALLNPGIPPFGRSSDDDFYASFFVWADVDHPHNPEELKELYKDLRPNCAVVTARKPYRRIQLFWKLKQPVTDPNILRAALGGVAKAMGGDTAVTNPTSLMRLGGTINYPSDKKRERDGRVNEITEFIKIHDKLTTIEEINAIFPPTQQTANVSVTGGDPTSKHITTRTYDDNKPRDLMGNINITAMLDQTKLPGKWHTSMRDAVGAMIGRKWSNEQIRTACAPYCDNGYNDPDLTPLIEAGRRKWDVQDIPPQINIEAALVDTDENNAIYATGIDELDLDNIPPRAWLFGTIAARKFVTIIGASPGAGKSIFTMQVGVTASAGKAFGTHAPQEENIKTWIFNNEEGEEELRRRLKGILVHEKINATDLKGRFYLNSGENRSICIARRNGQDGSVVYTPDYVALYNEVKSKEIDLLIVDPFAETHDLGENSNDEIKRVTALYRDIAVKCNCAVVLVHHTRKGNSSDTSSSEASGNADNLRGGGAQIGVARRVFTLAKMDEATAKKLDVPLDTRRWFIRLDDAKSNITAPAENAEWFKFKSIEIGNYSDLHKSGDNVGILIHKTVEEIATEGGAELQNERLLLLMRLARIMIQSGKLEASVSVCVKDLIADGYQKYKERKLHDFLSDTVSKMSKNTPVVCDGYRCKFSIIEGQNKRDGNKILVQISEITGDF